MRVLVTAASTSGAKLTHALVERGAIHVLHLPCIHVEEPADCVALDRAIDRIDSFDWVVVTSRNGASALVRRLDWKDHGGSNDSPNLAAVGPSTAAVLRDAGLPDPLVPSIATSLALSRKLLLSDLRDLAFLLLQGNLAGDTLPSALRSAGAQVTVVEAYRTVPGIVDVQEARRIEALGTFDAVTFMSGSAAQGLAAGMSEAWLSNQRCVCIGDSTAEVARELGFAVVAVAEIHTVAGLAEAVVKVLGDEPSGGR